MDGRSPTTIPLEWMTTSPMPAMSPIRTRTTPSGNRRWAATSATDLVSMHSSQIERCSGNRASSISQPRSLVETSASMARS